MKKHLIVFVIFIGIGLILINNPIFAQKKTGIIRGTVKDEAGEVLPGVKVEIKSEALMGTQAEITNERGTFRFPVLPIGVYEAAFTLQGFQTQSQKNLDVTIGGTVTLDIVLKQAALAEEINVHALAPLVDTAKSSFSSTFDSKVLEQLPTRRFTFFDFVQASPGLTPSDTESSRVSAFGSEDKSNAYYINGADSTAPSTHAAWLWPIPDAIEQIEVTGIGAPAEYGSFQGAVINVVTKSGSNTFHGSVKYFLQSQSLTANNTPDAKWPYHIAHWHDAVFSLGGPIIKDKLWFFSCFQYQMNKTTGIGADPAYPAKYQIAPMIIAKIDYQLNKKNKLTLYFHYNRYSWSPPPTEFQPYNTVAGENDWVVSPNAEWLSILSDKTYFEVKFASFFTYLWYDPISGNKTTPGRYDWATGYHSGNALYFYHWTTNRIQINGTVSHFAQDFIKGDHDFKCGIQYNRGYSDFIWGYWGGAKYYDWFGQPYLAYFRNPSHYGGINNQIGAFADDAWTVSNRLTVNLGVRFDYSHGKIPDFDELDKLEKPTGKKVPGIPDVATWKNISPRIGLNYQLTSDRKTVLRASFGRYYDPLVIGDVQAATPAQGILYVYRYNPVTKSYDDLLYSWSPLTNLGIDSQLRAPYTDQFSVALEREIWRDFSLSATFVYKRSLNRIARMNTAAQYTEEPFYDASSGKTITVYNQITPLQNFYLVTNPGDRLTYRGLMLVANKRFSNGSQLYSSLTLSRAWFDPKGYLDKNSLINAEGPMSLGGVGGLIDRTWMYKIGGSYLAPLQILFGLNVIYQQGAGWERTVRVPELNQGPKFIKAEPAASRRMPNELYFDAKLEKRIKIASRFSLSVSFDVFNLFNKNTNLQWVSTQVESPSWMVPTAIIMPRRAMLGLKLEF